MRPSTFQKMFPEELARLGCLDEVSGGRVATRPADSRPGSNGWLVMALIVMAVVAAIGMTVIYTP